MLFELYLMIMTSHGILLVDAENAFNALNRSTALHNTRIVCPEFSIYLINTYRKAAKLYIPNSGGKFILSQEGSTQGDNCASGLYACSMMPLMGSVSKIMIPQSLTPPQVQDSKSCSTIEHIPGKLAAKHIWLADDSAAGGTLSCLQMWWNNLI